MAEGDKILLQPQIPPFSPNTMFVCTYETLLTNIAMSTPQEMIVCLEPSGYVRALNCNYGHKAQKDYEHFIKRPKVVNPMVRQRKVQNDGSCFNSCVQAVIQFGKNIPQHGIKADKAYKLKTFPFSGKTQVPGVIDPGFRDGAFVARVWADYLTKSGIASDKNTVRATENKPLMVNYKFALNRTCDRIILHLNNIFDFLEKERDLEKSSLPYPIREIKNAQDKQNISFKFETPDPKPVRVNMFYRGKVNMLGARSPGPVKKIYEFISDIFVANWSRFVTIMPRPDKEVRPRPKTDTKTDNKNVTSKDTIGKKRVGVDTIGKKRVGKDATDKKQDGKNVVVDSVVVDELLDILTPPPSNVKEILDLASEFLDDALIHESDDDYVEQH